MIFRYVLQEINNNEWPMVQLNETNDEFKLKKIDE